MKFSAVRSAVMMLPAEPVMVAIAVPDGTFAPSFTSVRNLSSGSTSRNVIAAISTPETTPGALASSVARAPTLAGTELSVVTSPVPTSSDNANLTSGRKLSCTVSDPFRNDA
jgi:hypothetical protein